VEEEVVEQERLEHLELHLDQVEQVELEYLIIFQDQEYLMLVVVVVELPTHLLQVHQEEQHLLVELEELDLQLVQEHQEQLIEVEEEEVDHMLQDKQVVMGDRVLLLLEHHQQLHYL
jgi:hypothetical protein